MLIQTHFTPSVSSRWSKQIRFGMQAYGLHTFQSLAGNARQACHRPQTGLRKAERLLANEKLASQLGVVFDSLHLVHPSSFVNVDHSDMNGLTALVGAIQTRNGRAVPCFVETTYAHHIPADGSVRSTPRWRRLRQAMVATRRTQSFTGHTIDSLQDFADRLGFWPRLVFDRGFGNESLLMHLQSEGATFYVRLKAGRRITLNGQRIEVKRLNNADATVSLFGTTLRVVRSPKGRRSPEPWYILTNDQVSSRNRIVRIYYHRFEIEETFRDMKHIFELKRTRLRKPLSLKIVFWFVGLGIAILYLATKPTRRQIHAPHPKKQISWLRQAYEQLQQAFGLLLWEGG
jgi:hypothetical protein